MKKRDILWFVFLALGTLFTACNSDEEPFATVTADDEPRILDPVFPDRINGALATFANISRDANLSMKLTVTPADYTVVTWWIDGQEVESGTASDKELDIALKAGVYNLRIVAETVHGKTTTREGVVRVNPLPDDPWAATQAFERIVAPGMKARFYGDNLQKVMAVAVGGKSADEVAYVETEGDDYLEYSVPADMEEGDYRVVLRDAEGNEYGADKVKVSKRALVFSGAGRATAGMPWILTGLNLEHLASLTIGGQTVSDFTDRSPAEVTLTCPALPDGEYTLTGTDDKGNPVQFLAGDAVATEQTVVISTERTLWEGHHYVSWDKPDGDPNKTFNLIPMEVFAGIKAGAVLRIAYSVEPAAEYHQMQPATGWWSGLADKIEFSEAGVYELPLTQSVLDKIQAEAGFLCVGHGYYVDLVTLK